MANTTIKASQRNIKVVGTLSELNLIREDRDIMVNGKKVSGEAIHSPFGKPALVVEVNGNPVEMNLMWTNSLTKDGKPNPKFKAMETIMEQYVPKTKATAENPATRVEVSGMLGLNEYAKDESTFSSRMELSGMNCTRKLGDDEDQAEGVVTGIIKAIRPEMNKDGEETGRLILEMFLVVKDNGAMVIQPYTFIVPEECVEDYESLEHKKGDLVEVSFEVVSRTIGGKPKEVKGFGRRANVQQGFTVTEYLICGAEPAEEDEELQYNMEDVKTMLQERDMMIEAKLKEKKEKDSQPQNKSEAPKKTGMGKKANVSEIEDSELPF